MANLSEEEFTEKLVADIKRIAQAYCQGLVNSAADEYTQLAKDMIQKFYDNYNPTYYVRTGNIRDAIQRYKPKYHGRSYIGGVEISSDYMSDYRYQYRHGEKITYGGYKIDPVGDQDYKERVFTDVWEWGIHGSTHLMKVDPESPFERIEKEFNNLSSKTNTKIKKTAAQMANSVRRDVLEGFIVS